MKILLSVLALGFLAAELQASERLPDHGLRINVLWPIYPGKKYRLAYRLALHDQANYRTELIVGLGVDLPEERATEGRFSASSGSLALRQYFGKAWHVELMAAYGQGRLEDAVKTKLDYRSWDLELMGLIGYEWQLAKSWSLDLQGGAGKVVQKSNPWPIYEDDTLTKEVGEQAMPLGTLHLTYWF